MQLYVLHKNPEVSASLVPDKYKFKMLIELGQLICSAGISNVYKPIKQGKELQEWVNSYKYWTLLYFDTLLDWAKANVKMNDLTLRKLLTIKSDLINKHTYTDTCIEFPDEAYFRYKDGYVCDIPSKTLLPIEQCASEYKKYLEEFKGVELCSALT